jgi:energy-coupling factor transporter ATP-binding protein EcfA2
MRLTRLKIIRHRWCAPTELFLGAKRQLVLGPNGSGKTKLLELIAKVCRAVPDELSAEPLEVEADFEGAEGKGELRVHSRGYDLTWVNPRFGDEARKKYAITVSFTTKASSDWRSIPELEVNQDTRELENEGERFRIDSETSVWLDLRRFGRNRDVNFLGDHPVVMLGFLMGLRRFDESLGVYADMAQTEVKMNYADEESVAVYGQSNGAIRWIPTGTVAGGVEQRRASTLRVMPVPNIIRAATLLGYRSDVEVELRYRRPTEGQGLGGALFDSPELYLFKGDVRVRATDLSFGEKRVLSFMAYLNANPHIVIADELMNGLHHSLGLALLDEIGDRQAFLATHEPVLMDAVDFESADELRRSLILCRRNPDPKGPPFVWTQLSPEEAAEVFPYYPKSLMHGSQILKHWELW